MQPSPKPIANATIEPQGKRSQVPRDYAVKIAIALHSADEKFGDQSQVTGIARSALAAFPADSSGVDRRRFDVLLGKSNGKTPAPSIGLEASVVWPGRPDDQRIEQLRHALSSEGYLVTLRELRECVEPGCLATAQVTWNHGADVPRGWYSSDICGKHSYKSCPQCASVYAMTSENATAQAPSLHCEVCGGVLVEWGGSKVWNALLVTRGTAT